LAVAVPILCSAVPARAQDFFGIFRPFSPPIAAVPLYQPFEYRPVPALDPSKLRPKVRPRTKVARVEQPPIKMPEKPKAEGEIANPVPDLLADSTLRPGDMVMFPDGLRVFSGRPGAKHVLADFEPVSRAGKAVASATRKLVAPLRPGENDAWSVDQVKSSDKLVASIKDVRSTGSVKRKLD
jgi:hypothetical protein